MKDKLAPTLVAWILFDTTTDKKYIKMNPADGSLAIFDSEEAAIAAKKTHYGTDYKRCEYYSAPQQLEGFCEDAALSLAERTFSTEVDEQLAEDIIQYARRLHSRYTAPQPVPDAVVMQLFAGALEGLLGIVQESTGVTGWHLNGDVAGWDEFEEVEIAEEALALYRKQGGEL